MVDVSSLNRSPFGINCHEASDEMLDRLADAGIRWFRFDVEWRAVQPRRDAFEWSTTERIVRWAGRRGVSLLAVMAYAPQWAWAAGEKRKDDVDQGQRPADSRDWRTFVETVPSGLPKLGSGTRLRRTLWRLRLQRWRRSTMFLLLKRDRTFWQGYPRTKQRLSFMKNLGKEQGANRRGGASGDHRSDCSWALGGPRCSDAGFT